MHWKGAFKYKGAVPEYYVKYRDKNNKYTFLPHQVSRCI